MLKVTLVSILSLLFFNLNAQWEKLNSDSKASFRSIDASQGNIIWAGGSSNTILKSMDFGNSWKKIEVGKGHILDFRGVAALNSSTAIAVSAGLAEEGSAKIYRTSDSGLNWKLVFDSNEKGVFMDGVRFFNENEGIVYGDPINGKMFMLLTSDGGKTWNRSETAPTLAEGEASFAASNSNIVVTKNFAWIATQNRIFKSTDKGKSWKAAETYFPSGETAGIFGLHFWNKKKGLLIGGDYMKDKGDYVNVAFTKDGGKNWGEFMTIEPRGLKEAAWKIKGNKFLIVGTTGVSLFNLNTKKNEILSSEAYHALSCGSDYCFAIGPNGNVARLKKNL